MCGRADVRMRAQRKVVQAPNDIVWSGCDFYRILEKKTASIFLRREFRSSEIDFGPDKIS